MRRLLRRVLAALLALVAVLLAVVCVRALAARSHQRAVAPAPPIALDEKAAVAHLARSITFKTVSYQDAARDDRAEFDRFHAFLAEAYPRFHAALRREPHGASALLFTMEGREPQLAPVVLMAHQDVVPVEPGTEASWTHAPFGGVVDGGYVWGRSALDDKGSLIALLEATEAQLARGWKPRRTILFSFGADEEVGGVDGAARIAAALGDRGVRPAWVLDEGSMVLDGLLPGLRAPLASVNIAEKGFVSVELSVTTEGGHSSMPPRHTAVGLLARAIERIEDQPMPARLEAGASWEFAYVAPELPFATRAVFSNLWLFGPVLTRALSAKPSSNALVRTTAAATMFEGSVKDNVLPIHARAVVNFRILPGDDIEGVLAYVRRVVDDPGISIKRTESFASEPTPLAPIEHDGFRTVERVARETLPGVIVAPGLTLGATDARHFATIAERTLRFAPFTMRSDDLRRLHSTDERVAVADWLRGVQFYARLLEVLRD